MEDLRIFLSHTSDLDAPSNEGASFVGTAIHAIAALSGFSVEEQRTTFTAEDQTAAEVVRRSGPAPTEAWLTLGISRLPYGSGMRYRLRWITLRSIA